jgi:hypothetical protein
MILQKEHVPITLPHLEVVFRCGLVSHEIVSRRVTGRGRIDQTLYVVLKVSFPVLGTPPTSATGFL